MGFLKDAASAMGGNPAVGGDLAHPSFGSSVGQMFSDRHPVMGALLNGAFGQDQGNGVKPVQGIDPTVTANLRDLGTPAPADPYQSMINQNAKPKEGEGISLLLKMLGM